MRFRVDRDVLIPRPETEELIDRALKLAPRDRGIHCLDLGTGAGVIAVSLARYLPRARVTAVDISPHALRLAHENAVLNGVEDRVSFLESDWFSGVTGRFDLIVSNPPYIPEAELERLPNEVRDHEPRVAIDGGADGLERIAHLLESVCDHLCGGGHVLLEIGHTQSERVQRMMEEAGLTDVAIDVDLGGKDRFAVAQCP